MEGYILQWMDKALTKTKTKATITDKLTLQCPLNIAKGKKMLLILVDLSQQNSQCIMFDLKQLGDICTICIVIWIF